eukprot:jgi/Tetstr1/450304/TSEL_037340.t1
MDDKTLRQMVIDELDFEPSIDSADIGVAVEAGIVTLTGHVSSYSQKLKAEEVVNRVRGVRGIAEKIEIRVGHARQEDDQIAKRAVNSLQWDSSVPDEKIKVKVQNGWLTLTGEVDWDFERKAAEHAVRKLSGIIGVTNQIHLKARVQPTDVQQRIENALKRSAELEAKNIHVTVQDGTVKLHGKVKAWYERQLAESAAWAVPGVKAVADELTIQ